MRRLNTKFSVTKFTVLSTQIMYLMSLMATLAMSENVPHSQWGRTAFRLDNDTDVNPTSAFLLALDSSIFKNVTSLTHAILAKCTNLASTEVNSWDNESIDFETLKNYPSGIWKIQAEAYQTFANYQFGVRPTEATLNCINEVLKPLYETTPVIDWDWSVVGPVALVFVFLLVTLSCPTYCYFKSSQPSSTAEEPSVTETQGLFSGTTDTAINYGATNQDEEQDEDNVVMSV